MANDKKINPVTGLTEDSPSFDSVKYIKETFNKSNYTPPSGASTLDVGDLLRPVDVSKSIQAPSDPFSVRLTRPEELSRYTDLEELQRTRGERFQEARVARMEQLDAEQTYGEAINGNLKLLGKIVNRTVLGLGGTIWGAASSLLFWDADQLQENAVFDLSENIDKFLDESLPIYTNEDEYYNEGFFGKLWYHPTKFMGDEIGDALSFASSAVLQEVLFSTITAATFGGGAGLQAAGTARLAQQGTSIWNRISGASKIIKAARGLDKSAEGLKTLNALQQSARTAKLSDRFKNIAGSARSLLMSANYEAAIESRSTKEEMKQLLIQEYKAEHGTEPKGEELDKIEEAANKAKWLTYGGNMALLTLTNSAQFPRIFLKGYKGQRRLYKKLLDITDEGKFVSKLANKKGIVNASTVAIKSLAKGSIEGFEEASQGVINNTSLEYFSRKYGYNDNKKSLSIFEAFGRGAEEYFKSKEASTEVGLGFLIGLLGVPVPGVAVGSKRAITVSGGIAEEISKYKSNKKKAAIMAEYLNNTPDSHSAIKANFNNTVKNMSIQQDIDKAVASGDIFSFKNLEHDQYFSYLYSRIEAGMFDVIEDDLNKLKDKSLEEFSEDFSLGEATEFTEENKNVIIEKALEHARKVKDYYEVVSDLTDSTLTDDSIAKTVKEPLVHAAATISNLDRRELELTNKLNEITNIDPGTIEQATKEAFLYNKVERLQELINRKQKKEKLNKEQTEELTKLRKQLNIYPEELDSIVKGERSIDYKELRKLVGDVKIKGDTETGKANFFIEHEDFKKATKELVEDWANNNKGDAAIHAKEVEEILNDLVKIKNRRELFTNFYKYLTTPEGAEEFYKLQEEFIEVLGKHIFEDAEEQIDKNIEDAETSEEVNKATTKAYDTSDALGDKVSKKVDNKASKSKMATGALSADTLRTNSREALTKRYEGNPELLAKEAKEIRDALPEDFKYLRKGASLEDLIKFVEGVYAQDIEPSKEVLENYYANATTEVEDFIEKDNKVPDEIPTEDDEVGEEEPWLFTQEHTDPKWENPLRGAAKQFEMYGVMTDKGLRWRVEYNEVGLPIKTKNFFEVNWHKVNSRNTLKKGSKLEFEVDLDRVFGDEHEYSEFHKGAQGAGNFEKVFHIHIKAKDENGVEFTAAGLASYVDQLEDKENKKANEHILNIRKYILNELISKGIITRKGDKYSLNNDYKGKKFRSKLSTTVSSKGTGRVHISGNIASFEDALPLSQVLNEGEDLILGIGRPYGDTVIIDVPNTNIELKNFRGITPGAVYSLVKGANNEYVVTRLKTRKVNDQELDEVRGYLSDMHIHSNKKEDYIPFKEKINEIVFLDVYPTGNKIKQFKVKYKGKEGKEDTWSEGMTADEVISLIKDRRAQVSFKKINRGTYNKDIDGDKVRTVLTGGENKTHSAMFELNPVNFDEAEKEVKEETEEDRQRRIAEEREAKKPSFISAQFSKPSTKKVKNTEQEKEPLKSENKALEEDASLKEADEVKTDSKENDFDPDSVKPPKTTKKGLKGPKLGKGKKRFRKAEKGSYKLWNKEKELRWAKKTIKKIPIEVVESLNTLSKNGGDIAWGVFRNAAIEIAENAGTGTTYHEAFHAVFWLFLTDKQRHDILLEAQTKTGLQKDKNLEEWLADKFMEYVQTNKIDDSLKGRIKRFFSRLKAFINRLLNREEVYTIDRLFKVINDGHFRNRKPSVKGVKNFKDVVRWKIPGFNPMEEVERTNMVNWFVLDQIEELEFDNPELDLNGILRGIPLTDLYQQAYISIRDDYYYPLKQELEEDPENEYLKYQVSQLETTLASLIEGKNEEGNIKFGPLMEKAVNALRKHGIKVNIRSKEVNKDMESMEESLNFVAEEGNTFEAWQMTRAALSTKDTATYKVKKYLSRLPKYVKDEEGKIVGDLDTIGFPVNEDFDTTFNNLKHSLTEHYSVPDMLKTLIKEAKFRPNYREIANRLENDVEFRASFFHAMATQKINYTTLLETQTTDKNGITHSEFKVLDANKRSPERVLIGKWAEIFKSKNIKGDKIKIQKIKDIKEELEAIIDKLEAKKVGELSRYYGDKISKLLGAFGMDITSRELRDYFDNIDKFSKLFKGKGILNTAFDAAIKGRDPFTFGKQGELKSITPFIDMAVKLRPALYEHSMMNVENKIVFSNIAPNYLSRLVTELKANNNVIKLLQKDKFYKRSKWLNELKNLEEKNIFERAVLDGIKIAGADKGTKYTSLSPFQRMVTDFNMFNNDNNDEYGYYSVPILADAPQLNFIKFKKYGSGEVLEAFIDVARQEVERNAFIKNRKGKDPLVKNYSEGFYYLPFLKNVDTSNRNAVKEAIKKYLSTQIEEITSQMEDLGMLERLGETILPKNGMPTNINIKEEIAKYVYNKELANIQMVQIFSGDVAFYKSHEDIIKRNKQITNPGNILDIDAMGKDTYKTIYLKDEEFTSKFIDRIKEAVSNLPDKVAKKIIAQYTKSKDHEGIVQTDAQAYISLDRYRDIMRGAGLWERKHDKAYPKLKAGTATEKELALVLQPIKPFYFGNIELEGKIIPTQNKNSEFLLLPQLAKGNPKLEKIMELFENGIDSVQFNSAVKVGEHKTLGFKSIEEGDVKDLAANNTIILKNKDYRIQLAVPEHHYDTEILIGTQLRKLIIANLVDDLQRDLDGLPPHKYNINGKKYSSKELFDLYQELNISNIKESFSEVKELFTKDNRNKLRVLLVDEIRNRGLGQKYIDALELDSKGEFKFPLYLPLSAKRNESLLNSLFKNRVTKQKIKGGSFVQVTDFGITKDVGTSDVLEFNMDENGNIEMEAMLPWWSKKFFPVDENGEVDISKIPENLRELVGFRIPTEDKYSMITIKVVGFTPKEAGGVAILPSDITRLSGSDFDIDKIFIMMPEFEIKTKDLNQAAIEKEYFNFISTLQYSPKAGKDIIRKDIKDFDPARARAEYAKVKGIKWDNKTGNWIGPKVIEKVPSGKDTREARNNFMLDIIKTILKDSEHIEEAINPGGFDRLKSVKNNLNKLRKKDSGKISITKVADQLELFKRNIPSIALRGIFVNHNNNHAILQHTKVRLAKSIKFNNKDYSYLNTRRSKDLGDNEFISRTLAEFVAASVDNVKDPVLSDLNINLFTADTAALLIRLGYDLETTMLFINQPIIIELTNRFINEGSKAYRLKVLIKELSDNLVAQGANPDKKGRAFYNINSSGMVKAIEKEASPDHQLTILEKFNYIQKQAASLSDLVDALRGDGKPAGPTMAANEIFLNKRTKVLFDERLEGVEDVIKGDAYPMIREFTDLGIVEANKLLSEHFPWYNKSFKYVKKTLSTHKGRDLTEREIEFINYALLSYIGSKFEFFDIAKEEADYLINTFPEELIGIINKDETLKNNLFTSNLIVEPVEKGAELKVISFNNTSKLSDLQKQHIDDIFSWMLEQNEYRELAENLIKYSFLKGGFTFGPNTFNHLVPINFYNNLRDSKGNSFYNFLKDSIDPMEGTEKEMQIRALAAFEEMSLSEDITTSTKAEKIFLMGEEEVLMATDLLPKDLYDKYLGTNEDLLSDFFVFFHRNFYDSHDFVPKIIRGKDVKAERVTYDDSFTNPISITIDPTEVPLSNTFTTDPTFGEHNFQPVIKIESEGNTFLFYNAGKDQNGNAIYYRMLRAGKKGQVIEYTNLRTNRSSILEENVITFNIGGKNIIWGSGSIENLRKTLIDNNIDPSRYLPTVDRFDLAEKREELAEQEETEETEESKSGGFFSQFGATKESQKDAYERLVEEENKRSEEEDNDSGCIF